MPELQLPPSLIPQMQQPPDLEALMMQPTPEALMLDPITELIATNPELLGTSLPKELGENPDLFITNFSVPCDNGCDYVNPKQ